MIKQYAKAWTRNQVIHGGWVLITGIVGRVAFILMAMLATDSAGQNWPRFRGPNGTGVAGEINIPSTWGEADVAWKTELPGEGHSSPVIWGERVFLLSANPDGETRHAIGLDASGGDIVWTRSFPAATHSIHARSSYASSTPAVDDQRVYAIWGSPENLKVMAFDHEGETVWQRDLGPFHGRHGYGNSPILVDDLVIITVIHGDEKSGHADDSRSFVMAVNRESGETVWETPRGNETSSYSAPVIRQLENGQQEIVGFSPNEGMFGLDPATGDENWSLEVFDKRTIGTPTLMHGLVFGTVGSGGGGHYLVAVRPGSEPEEVYRVERISPYVPSVLAVDDSLYLWHDEGKVSCVNVADGEPIWTERIGGNYSSSPICAGSRIFGVSDEGEVVVLAASPEFQLLGRNPLGELTRASPAIAGGRLYIRTVSHLICVGPGPTRQVSQLK